MKKLLSIVVMVLGVCRLGYAQDIQVFSSFADFKSVLEYENDTTYVVNFWATWCMPCVAELPYFEQLEASFSAPVKVILVSLDFPKQIESRLIPFVERKGLQSEVVALTDGKFNDWIDLVDPSWSGAIPATYIYKAKRHVFYERSFEDLEALRKVVEPFLSK